MHLPMKATAMNIHVAVCSSRRHGPHGSSPNVHLALDGELQHLAKIWREQITVMTSRRSGFAPLAPALKFTFKGFRN